MAQQNLCPFRLDNDGRVRDAKPEKIESGRDGHPECFRGLELQMEDVAEKIGETSTSAPHGFFAFTKNQEIVRVAHESNSQPLKMPVERVQVNVGKKGRNRFSLG